MNVCKKGCDLIKGGYTFRLLAVSGLWDTIYIMFIIIMIIIIIIIIIIITITAAAVVVVVSYLINFVSVTIFEFCPLVLPIN